MDEQQPSPNIENYQPVDNSQKDKSRVDLAVLLLGIFSFIVPSLNIAGIITYFFSNKSSGKSIIGLILSILSLMLTVLTILFVVAFLIPSYNTMVEAEENLPNIDLNNNFRAEPTQSQINSGNNAMLVTFTYNGNDRITISSNDSSAITTSEGQCNVNFIKNVDSAQAMGESQFQVEGNGNREITFLRSQMGVIEFKCDDNINLNSGEMAEGDILVVAESARTGVPIRSSGMFKIKIS